MRVMNTPSHPNPPHPPAPNAPISAPGQVEMGRGSVGRRLMVLFYGCCFVYSMGDGASEGSVCIPAEAKGLNGG